MKNNERIKKLESELLKLQNEFRIFYEITQAMRTSLNFDEVLYIILTGITSHQGLGFNRAAIFFADFNEKKIKGIMGIGPAEPQEAEQIWKWIEEEKKDLYDLISQYHKIKESKDKPKFFQLVKNLTFPFSKEAGVLYDVFAEGFPLTIDKDSIPNIENDPLYKVFLFEKAAFEPLWAKDQVIAVLFVDNFVTKKPITSKDLSILNMFASQAGLAIENSKLYEDTLFKSHTDSLTGLWNYGYFQYKLDEQIGISSRLNKTLCLLMIDIDGFKKYNDTFGHMEGDRVLINIASIIKNVSRKEDLVCRYGGEEFTVILPDISLKDTRVIAERIRVSIQDGQSLFKQKMTVSIGISSFSQNCPDKNSLVKRADANLYSAKAEGKNKVCCA